MSAFKFMETTLDWYKTKKEHSGKERAQLICPVCGKHTQVRVNRDTDIKAMPLICYKYCHSLTLIDYSKGIERVHDEKHSW